MHVTRERSETGIFIQTFSSEGDGLRVAVKDTVDMAGEVTSGGSRALAGAAPALQNAEIIDRLKQAGCRIVGRTNMHEFAYGVTGLNNWAGTPTNTNYPTLIPGGSSSGSAVAVATGLVDFAIGTDTGGSVRVPATCCGVIGLKPSFGRVSRKGLVPAISSLDCVGSFARDMAMIETAMEILVPDWKPSTLGTRGRVAFVKTAADEPISEMVRRAGEAAFEVGEIELAEFDAAMGAGMKIIARETWDAFGTLTQTGLVGRDVHDRLLMSSKVTDDELAEAEETRARFTAQVDKILETVDALILPTMPCLPPSLLEASDAHAAIPITTTCRPFNLSGHPAISLPIGEVDGRPVAMQLVGKHGEDEALCALARQVTIFQKGEKP